MKKKTNSINFYNIPEKLINNDDLKEYSDLLMKHQLEKTELMNNVVKGVITSLSILSSVTLAYIGKEKRNINGENEGGSK